jgi:hypothetical protein
MNSQEDSQQDIENSKNAEIPPISPDQGEIRQIDELQKDESYYQGLQEQKIIEDIKIHSKDLWYTKLIVQKTWIIILVSIVLSFILAILCIVLGGFEMAEDHDREVMIWSSKQVQEWDMLELAKEKVQTNYPDGVQPLRTTVMRKWLTSVTFE